MLPTRIHVTYNVVYIVDVLMIIHNRQKDSIGLVESFSLKLLPLSWIQNKESYTKECTIYLKTFLPEFLHVVFVPQ